MPTRRHLRILFGMNALLLMLNRRRIVPALEQAQAGWQQDPKRMVGEILFSFICGQGVFWKFGYDFIGLAMKPRAQMGLGQTVGSAVSARLPKYPSVVWIVKAVEILADWGKIPIEGSLYRQTGVVPDAIACTVTQPLWSTLEVAEKLAGVLAYPERVNDPDQIRASIGSIYGSLFRYVLCGAIWLATRHRPRPLTKGLA